MLNELKETVFLANLDLVRHGLVILTFGNVSGIDRDKGILAIKPSGVSYEKMRPADMVLVDLGGKVVEGRWTPSSDTPAHIALYKAFPDIGGIAHTHSEYATAFAQAAKEIPCLGTTHADHFDGPVPVTRFLNPAEVKTGYEARTGAIIVERFARLRSLEMPAVLVAGHGPFCWGRTPAEAVRNNVVLEKTAKMAIMTRLANPQGKVLPAYILRKHFSRKHGPHAYYGQKESPQTRTRRPKK